MSKSSYPFFSTQRWRRATVLVLGASGALVTATVDNGLTTIPSPGQRDLRLADDAGRVDHDHDETRL